MLARKYGRCFCLFCQLDRLRSQVTTAEEVCEVFRCQYDGLTLAINRGERFLFQLTSLDEFDCLRMLNILQMLDELQREDSGTHCWPAYCIEVG